MRSKGKAGSTLFSVSGWSCTHKADKTSWIYLVIPLECFMLDCWTSHPIPVFNRISRDPLILFKQRLTRLKGGIYGCDPFLFFSVVTCTVLTVVTGGSTTSIWSSWALLPRRISPERAQSPGRQCGQRGRSGCLPCSAGRGTRSAGSVGTLWLPWLAAEGCWSSLCTQDLQDKIRKDTVRSSASKVCYGNNAHNFRLHFFMISNWNHLSFLYFTMFWNVVFIME